MDENKDLCFDFPLCEKSVYELEKTIKMYMRRYSVDLPKEKDIERFSDTYNDSKLVDFETIKSYLIPDLLPVELQSYFNFAKQDQQDVAIPNDSFNMDLENEEESLEMEASSDLDDDYKIKIGDQDDSSSKGEDDGVII